MNFILIAMIIIMVEFILLEGSVFLLFLKYLKENKKEKTDEKRKHILQLAIILITILIAFIVSEIVLAIMYRWI
ncbi:MAG: hypothetical protein RR229_00580 [Oscillospiraceae bacterium]